MRIMRLCVAAAWMCDHAFGCENAAHAPPAPRNRITARGSRGHRMFPDVLPPLAATEPIFPFLLIPRQPGPNLASGASLAPSRVWMVQ